MRIPLSAPEITQSEIDAVSEVLRSGRLSLGPKLREFEAQVARYCGAALAVGVSSGTAGLHLSVRALGIGEGDEVILPSFTFVAAANVLRYERAVPVFVDIDRGTLNLDPALVEAAITPRTRAILVVHTFGVPAELNALCEIARRRNLIVIEDACEAMGGEYGGRKVGTFGEAGAFAFYPNKQITTAEGGMVVTNKAELSSRVKSLRNQGRGLEDEWLQHGEMGFNYRLSELHATLGVEQFKRLETILERREAIARGYHERLAKHPGLELPPLAAPNRRISWFVFVVRLREAFGRAERDELVGKLAARGIETARYFAPIHLQPAYRDLPAPRTPLSVTESIGKRTLALPFFNRITDSQVDEVCAVLWELLPA
ncbi:MAG TPA: DegT/DnrJ/EryC1/StrS family aminotransferase [Terriglobales bacterium]|nr:DegT/DnrJ/EryC1/StrS family aminotransferase [Terriglobales bacterium]